MLVVGLLSGIAYQESSKKLSDASGVGHWDAALPLALVHGHIILTGVLLPVAMACMLHLSRLCGGAAVSTRALKWVVWTYLPFLTVSLCLMLYKGYHILLAVRAGVTDMAEINAGFFAGSKALRHAVYGLSHAGMAFGLCLFAWCVWRSLKVRSQST